MLVLIDSCGKKMKTRKVDGTEEPDDVVIKMNVVVVWHYDSLQLMSDSMML